MDSSEPQKINHTGELFRKLWPLVTDDNNVTLHGFRRFKTTHLLNLRFLEQEISELDRVIYQAGLGSGHSPSTRDRLGLRHSNVDHNTPAFGDTITRELVLKLRNLLQQYGPWDLRISLAGNVTNATLDEALAAFTCVMDMETISLLDDEKQSNMQTDLTLFEKYNTRLVRVDLGTRARIDPLQRWLHKKLRALRYWRVTVKQNSFMSFLSLSEDHWSYQNTVIIASVAGRIISAIIVSLFLITPLVILSAWSIKGSRLAVVCGCIALFSAIVAAMLKVSSYEMMAAVAAYAAVLSVFVSNGS